MINRIKRYVKLIPLILLGVAVIVWTSIFRRDTDQGGRTAPPDKGEPPIFPY